MPRRNSTSKHKPRELRRRLVVPARIRTTAGWSDACILNISSRGLLMHTKLRVSAASMVEIQHGEHVIQARVVWRDGSRIGLCAETMLSADDILSAGKAASLPPPKRWAADSRPPSHERNRQRSRLMEFVSVALIVTSLSIAVSALVARSLAAPMSRVSQALDSHRGP
jgi:hypothetical protein